MPPPLIDPLAAHGVWVTPAEVFWVASEPAPQAVRICISAAESRAALASALEIVAETLRRPAPVPWRTL